MSTEETSFLNAVGHRRRAPSSPKRTNWKKPFEDLKHHPIAVCAGLMAVAAGTAWGVQEKVIVGPLQSQNGRLKEELEGLRKAGSSNRDTPQAQPTAATEVLDFQNIQFMRSLVLDPPEGMPGAAFQPGDILVTANDTSQALYFWDVRSGALKHRLSGERNFSAVATLNDGLQIAGAGFHRVFGFYDPKTDKKRATVGSYADETSSSKLAANLSGRVVAHSWGNVLTITNTLSGAFYTTNFTSRIADLCITPEDTHIFVASGLSVFRFVEESKQTACDLTQTFGSKVVAIAASRHAGFAAGFNDTSVHLFNTSLKDSKEIGARSKDISALRFSRDGSLLIIGKGSAAAKGCFVEGWNVESGVKVFSAPCGNLSAITTIAVSQNGDFIAVAGYEGGVTVFRVPRIKSSFVAQAG